MRRVQLRVPVVLRDPDVVTDGHKARSVELHTRVDAIVRGPVRRQRAGVGWALAVEPEPRRRRVRAAGGRARQPPVVEVDADSSVGGHG